MARWLKPRENWRSDGATLKPRPFKQAVELSLDRTHSTRSARSGQAARAAVPDGFGINDDVGTVLALVEASGLVRADTAFESALGQLLLEEFLQAGFGLGIAASAGMACGTLVAADEDVMFEFGHQTIVAGLTSSVLATSASQMPSKSTKYPSISISGIATLRLAA